MESNSDSALMLKVKAGDLDKMGLLFERYHRRLFRFFYRLTRRHDRSEDLVQEVFERIIKYRHTYTNSGSFSTWIFQIARNLHADHHREQSSMPVEDDLPKWEDMEGYNLNPDPGPHEEELKLMYRALDNLDSEKKETLVLSRLEGFKYKEIAEIMNCSESAVKVRIYRTLKELKASIDELSKEHKNYE